MGFQVRRHQYACVLRPVIVIFSCLRASKFETPQYDDVVFKYFHDSDVSKND